MLFKSIGNSITAVMIVACFNIIEQITQEVGVCFAVERALKKCADLFSSLFFVHTLHPFLVDGENYFPLIDSFVLGGILVFYHPNVLAENG